VRRIRRMVPRRSKAMATRSATIYGRLLGASVDNWQRERVLI
jgi:hypothetical protein